MQYEFRDAIYYTTRFGYKKEHKIILLRASDQLETPKDKDVRYCTVGKFIQSDGLNRIT